ncbi:MAG: hypothetical protein QOE95_2558 [Gaiellaceae bacterium]|nr:hypothetical protein [Gaiellaceae bacterium]
MPVGDGDLRSALEGVLRRPVRALVRRTHPYVSSHAIEDVEVTFEDGAPLALVIKDVLAPRREARGAKPPRLLDPAREIETYRHALARAGLDVPTCYGTIEQPGRRWLVLEAVEGIPLWQTADAEDWDAAARWLAGLHARGVPVRRGHLLRYDAAYLHDWLRHAVALMPRGALDAVAAVWQRVVERVAAWPCSIVHGDFYASNVLVGRARGVPRVRPVDWELAGVGPGVLDLAAITSGSWNAAERERIALAYHRAMPLATRPRRGDFLDVLQHCRLLIAVQWLGWSRDWSAPAEHAHDWLTEATALARELGPSGGSHALIRPRSRLTAAALYAGS